MLFDTHTHFNFNAFKDDWEKVIERTLAQDIWFANVGAEAKTSQRAVDIAKKYPRGVFASVGLHPIHTHDDQYTEIINGEQVKFATKAEEFNAEYYTELIKQSEKIVAVGEIGLDYFHIRKFSTAIQRKLKKKQIKIFSEQIELAGKFSKPIIIHCRHFKDYDAYRDILELLKDKRKVLPELPGIVHCFSANPAIMDDFLSQGFMLGFNGIITFTDDYDKLVLGAPLDRIVLETDSPWLAPVPYRGKRNESVYVTEVAKRIAELKKIKFEEVANATTENSLRLFKIKK